MSSLLDSSILGQLLLMQSVLTSLPDEKSIFDFACRGLRDIPGVEKVIQSSMITAGSADSLVRFPLEVNNVSNGVLCFSILDREAFAPYEPYIKNLCVIISVILEEQKQRKTIEAYSHNLQAKVILRTEQLEEEITKHKKTAEELREIADKFSAIFDQSSEGIFLHDFDGRIIEVNRIGCIQTGYTRDELLSMSVFDLHKNNEGSTNITKERIFKEWRNWSEHNVFKMEAEHVRKDGTVFPINLSTGVIQYGGKRHILAIVQDISEKKQSDSEKEKLQQQLYQAQKMESIGVLAGGVAHDFNNMLGVILGNIQLMKSNPDSSFSNCEEIEEIINAAKRSRDLTSKLLLFSRKHTARELSVVQISHFFNDLNGMLLRTAPQNIKVRTDIIQNCIIECDANQIHQALLNLCINAIDAMPRGGNLDISCKQVDNIANKYLSCGKDLDGEYCEIRVSDNGIGMPEDHIEKVVEPFFTTKGVGKGTGLGLSVTHGIIVGHNGHMHIESELGKGTCISVFLPISKNSLSIESGADSAMDNGGNETILVVDDETSMLKMASKILIKAGYKPICVDNGKQAVEIYSKRHDEISLVILDMMMPEMDGADVFGRLKEIHSDVKVLFASGQDMVREAEYLFDKAKHQFLQKPYLMEEVLKTIRELIDN